MPDAGGACVCAKLERGWDGGGAIGMQLSVRGGGGDKIRQYHSTAVSVRSSRVMKLCAFCCVVLPDLVTKNLRHEYAARLFFALLKINTYCDEPLVLFVCVCVCAWV